MDIKQLEQLRNTIDKYIEAKQRKDLHCGEYSSYSEEAQLEAKDLFDFRKMQLEERCKWTLCLLGEE